ncbi:MAG: hypothetical protein ACYC7E_22565 [Armatimonadota bacterium]
MRAVIPFIVTCLLAAIVPLYSPTVHHDPTPFPGWPTSFDGVPLQALPLTTRERQFAQKFPGKIGRFTDGRREIVIRWVTQETRTLHSAADCFRGTGYTIMPAPLIRDTHHRYWSTFTAHKGGEQLRVRELITDTDGHAWNDVSAWYWSAVFQRTHGPWWAYSVAERETLVLP